MSTVAKKVLMGSGAVAGAYEIEQSLIFDSGDQSSMTRTPGTAGNRKTWTFSTWIKPGDATATKSLLFGNSGGTGQSAYLMFRVQANAQLYVQIYNTGALQTNRMLRDTSAWYHIMLVFNTTLGTADDRMKIYINGVQETSFNLRENPDQNLDTVINSTSPTWVGSRATSLSLAFNGYMAETYLIDGAAKTPSDFGETNDDTGQWLPKEYSGSFGTNGFYLPFKIGDLYSADFDGSGDYLSGSQTAIGSGDFTIEGWCNRADTGNQGIFQYSDGALNSKSGALGLGLYNSNFYLYYGTSGALAGREVTASIPAINTWWHFAYVRASGTITIYLNGTAVTTQSSTTDYTDTTLVVGGYYSTSFLWNGLISNFRAVKGTAVYTSNFTPPTAALTSISGTVLLNCQNSNVATSTTGSNMTAQGDAVAINTSPTDFNDSFSGDRSGQGNSFIAANLANYDVVKDSPTNNFCTMNALSNAHYVASITGGGHTLKYGNLRVDGQSDNNGIAATIAIPSSGKWYWEFTFNAAANGQRAMMFGIYAPEVANLAGGVGVDGWYALGSHNGDLYKASAEEDFSGSFGTSDVLQVAVDMDNGAIYFGKNNTWANSGDPTSGASKTGAGGTDLISSGYTWVPAVKLHWRDTAGTFFSNFGQSSAFGGTYNSLEPQGNADANDIGDFYYAPPTGYLALCTANLSDPAIPLPSAHFNPVLYTGNGSTQSISGVGHQPDLVWIKNRATTDSNKLTDVVRGVTKEFESDVYDAEETNADGLTAFASDGFALGDDDEYNTNNEAYVAWNWKANGSGSANTVGDVDTVVSANTAAGFSIVNWTGTNASDKSFGHGLSKDLDFVIIKAAVGSNGGAWVTQSSATVNNYMYLHTSGAEGAATNFQVDITRSNDGTFHIGNHGTLNNINADMIAYCFHSVAGYSSIGRYTGNNNADGPFVNLGFKPAFLLTRRTDVANSWHVLDNARSPENPANELLLWDTSAAEDTYINVDFLSNGFKVRFTHAAHNANGGTYLYMAFAESPFKYATAR